MAALGDVGQRFVAVATGGAQNFGARVAHGNGDGLADAGVGTRHQSAFAFKRKGVHLRSPIATMSMSVKSTLSPAMAQQKV